MINRKTFIKQIGLGSGGVMLLPVMGVLHGCEYKPQNRLALTRADVSLLDEIGETIIPTTDELPGAKATNIGEYILLMYQDCMPEEEQQILLEGINFLDSLSARSYSGSFSDAEAGQKKQLLSEIQAEAVAYNLEHEGEEDLVPHYFDILKGLTLSGYFTSEIGMTQARAYLPVPGQFVACMPYTKTDKVWAL